MEREDPQLDEVKSGDVVVPIIAVRSAYSQDEC